MKKYDVFLFDADGTLFDYNAAEAVALEATFARYGFAYSPQVRQKYREINAKAWRDYELGIVTKAQLQVTRFEKLLAHVGQTADAQRFNDEYLLELGRGGILNDGAEEICAKIVSVGGKIYIVTNGILATQTTRLEHSRIKNYVSDMFVSEQVGTQKPNIEYFEHVFAHIPERDKSKMLIIGDSLMADIAGGCGAGIDTCWLNESHAENATSIVPTHEIAVLSELNALL